MSELAAERGIDVSWNGKSGSEWAVNVLGRSQFTLKQLYSNGDWSLFLDGNSQNPDDVSLHNDGVYIRERLFDSLFVITDEVRLFLGVIAGEAIGANESTWKAEAHTIMNRVSEPRDVWSNAKTVTDVLTKAQYNAVGDNQYNLMQAYINNRDGSNAKYESLIAAVLPIYAGNEADFTGGAHYIFNVNGSAALEADLKSQPNRYTKLGPFNGISDTAYRMYRCEW